MPLTTLATALVASLNTAPAGQLADMLRAMPFGSFVRAMPIPLNGQAISAAAVNPYVAAAAQSATLPDDAKAALIYRAYARAGTATPKPLIIDTPDPAGAAAAPAAGHMAISPNGDLVFNAADAWTSVDVLYLPAKYDLVEQSLPVATNTLALPAKLGSAMLLLEVEALVGTTVGKKIIDAPATAVAAAHAALDAGKLNVAFNAADAVTSARVKYAVYNKVDLNALLETAQNYF